MKRFTVASGEAIGLFAQKMGMKLFANKGKVEIQAQNYALEMTSLKNMKLTSVDGSHIMSAEKKLILTCQGAYIKLSGGNVEIGLPKNILNKAITVQKMPKNALNIKVNPLSTLQHSNREIQSSFKLLTAESQEPVANKIYAVKKEDGRLLLGKTDGNGETQRMTRTDKHNMNNMKVVFLPPIEIGITKIDALRWQIILIWLV